MANENHGQQRRPLAGLRVLDLTRLVPGGYATQMLADFGADVIKVEDPRGGDPARWSEPLRDGVSLNFVALNRNKRSLAIDLKAPAGRDALLRLIATADVLVESFRPGVMEHLGLGSAMLRARFPRLIYCAITGYGQDGPARQRPGHDLNFMGYAGLLDMNRVAGGVPVLPPTQIADIAAGAQPAVIGILLALLGRSITGQGESIDVAMLDGALALQPLLTMLTLTTGATPAPGEPPLHGGDPAYAIYATRDGRYVTLAALEPKFWVRFCQLVARPDLIPLHGTLAHERRDEIRQQLAAIFAQRPRDEWLALLADEETCVGPVNTVSEALDDPQLRARHTIRTANLGFDVAGRTIAPTPRLAAAPLPPNDAPPLLGEHSTMVLAEAGLSRDEIAALRRLGIVPTTDKPSPGTA